MDERKIKRLLVMLAMAVVAIMIAKYMLARTVRTLEQANLEKQRAVAARLTPIAASAPPPVAPLPQPASAVAPDGVSGVPLTDSARTGM